MIKKVILRGLLGFPIGVFIAYTITIIFSLIFAKGDYSPADPVLVKECGSQINAVLLQFVFAGILGAASAGGSTIFEIDHWSILKQTVIHFLVLSLSMLPIAYFSYWMEHTLLGFAVYFGVFILVYTILWISLFFYWKGKIKEINRKIMGQ